MINGATCLLLPTKPHPSHAPVSPRSPHPGEPRAPVSVSLSIRYTPARAIRSVNQSVRLSVPSPCC